MSGWGSAAPDVGLISGFGDGEADAVIDGYEQRGLRERRRLAREGWVVAEVRRA